MPFLRLQEAIRLAMKAKGEREEAEWKRAAFIGYQRYLLNPRQKGKEPMSFGEWLDMIGLGEKREIPAMTIKKEVSLVKKLRRMARRAFGGG